MYLRAGAVVHQPTLIEEVVALPMRIYHFIVFFIMTLINPKAAKQGPGGKGAARGGFGANRLGSGGSSGGGGPSGGGGGPSGGGPGGGGPGGPGKRMGGMGTLKGARRVPPTLDLS